LNETTQSIAIDGPAGAGKSTIAKRVAAGLGFAYVDSGAIYRTCALYFVEKFAADSRGAVEDPVRLAAEIDNFDIGFVVTEKLDFKVLLNGRDVSGRIRTQEVSRFVPEVASRIPVRDKVNKRLREFAATHRVVMDGRDIGTCVLPASRLKVFLTASPEVRAERRLRELIEKNEKATFEAVYKDVVERDRMDETRPVAPLVKAGDAVEVDSTAMNIDQVVSTILDLSRERFK